MLHAWRLAFHHPLSGEWKRFEAPIPRDFQSAAKTLPLPSASAPPA
jgi:hypothetical protein